MTGPEPLAAILPRVLSAVVERHSCASVPLAVKSLTISPEPMPKHTMERAKVPLIEAARVLGITYQATMNRVLRGTLEGTREHGRWYVYADALESARTR